jgi:hypothetical protein
MFVHLPRGRNDEGVELQERRLAVVNVPFTRGKPVCLSFSISDIRLQWNHAEELLSGRITEEGRETETESNASEECKERTEQE